VVVLCLVGSDRAVERISVCSRPYDSNVEDARQLAQIRPRNGLQEIDASARNLRKGLLRVAEQSSPVGTGAIVESAHECHEAMSRRRVEITPEPGISFLTRALDAVAKAHQSGDVFQRDAAICFEACPSLRDPSE
jgi:hypothetical protein